MQLLLAGIWLFAGIAKLINNHHFSNVLNEHSVLPLTLVPVVSSAAPALEVTLGIGLILLPESRGSRACAVVPMCSFALLALLAVYMFLVPPESLRNAGCGCTGSRIDASNVESRGRHIVMLAGLLLLHAPLFPGVNGRHAGNP